MTMKWLERSIYDTLSDIKECHRLAAPLVKQMDRHVRFVDTARAYVFAFNRNRLEIIEIHARNMQ